jgi:acetylornithine/succinyldiaminopimelate/putrescine aminotransferase
MNQRQIFQALIAQTSDEPISLEVDHAEGSFIYDRDGRKYLDLISGIGVSIVGHRHPHVIKAIRNQIDMYMHTMVYGEHIQTPQLKLATILSETLPDKLNNFYFTNSGTEAVEGAIKLARRYTGRTKIISMKNAYHGSTTGAAALMSESHFTGKYRPLLPDVAHLTFNALEELHVIDTNTAAVFIEIIQAEAGIYCIDPTFATALANRCKQTGTLLVIDEIQSGLGRSGSWWAFEHYNIVPDILLSAKGLGGGLPLGVFISNKEIMSCIASKPILGHLTTFGGNPVSCAAATATIEVIRDENLIEAVAEKSKLLERINSSGKVVALRKSGIWAAIELENFEMVKKVIADLREAGILSDWFLFNSKSLRIAPPLNISTEELENTVEILTKVLY